VVAGTDMYERGDLPTEVHIVRAGQVDLIEEIEGRTVTVKRLGPGEPFGDIPLLLRRSEPFTARTVVDSTVLSIESTTLFHLLGGRPRLARRWLVSVADRMHGTQQRVLDLLAGSLEEQIGSLLLHDAVDGTVWASQAALAQQLGASRTRVNQALGRLEAQGLVRRGYGHIEIVDRRGLGVRAGRLEVG
jgi:CRP-like cAMP-binding protein